MDKAFVAVFIILCCCTSSSPDVPVEVEGGVSEHHIWGAGDSWTYLAIPPGHPDRSAGVWTYEIIGMDRVDGRELAILEKRFVWGNQTAYLIREYRDPSSLGLYKRVVVNPGFNKTDYIEEYASPVGSIKYPLYVGKSWRDYSAYVRYKPDIPREEYSTEGSMATENTISGIEVVETGAGTFQTFVIDVHEFEDGEKGFSGRLYFSPELGKYVKLEGGRFELILGNYSFHDR